MIVAANSQPRDPTACRIGGANTIVRSSDRTTAVGCEPASQFRARENSAMETLRNGDSAHPRTIEAARLVPWRPNSGPRAALGEEGSERPKKENGPPRDLSPAGSGRAQHFEPAFRKFDGFCALSSVNAEPSNYHTIFFGDLSGLWIELFVFF